MDKVIKNILHKINKKTGAFIADNLFPIIIAIFLLCLIGWIKNIIKLSDCDFQAPYKCEVVHVVGLIPPVGAVTGWMDFGK